MAITQSVDQDLRLSNIIRLGQVAAVKYAPLRVRVQTGNNLTGWLRCQTQRAGGIKTWSPPTLGEECIILSPSGELTQGIVIAGLNNETHPTPSTDPNAEVTQYPDGALIQYDHHNHKLDVVLPESSSANIKATAINLEATTISLKANAVVIDADVAISQSLTVQGIIRSLTDVIAKTISLVTHRHKDVQSGSGTSGLPL